jgi:YCII-related domain
MFVAVDPPTGWRRDSLRPNVPAWEYYAVASFLFIYRAGPDPVPAERFAENRAAWGAWNEMLHEDYGIRTAGGKSVNSGQVSEYAGDVRGASMVEFESMDAALEVAKHAPNLAFGGTVEVLQEFDTAH